MGLSGSAGLVTTKARCACWTTSMRARSRRWTRTESARAASWASLTTRFRAARSSSASVGFDWSAGRATTQRCWLSEPRSSKRPSRSPSSRTSTASRLSRRFSSRSASSCRFSADAKNPRRSVVRCAKYRAPSRTRPSTASSPSTPASTTRRRFDDGRSSGFASSSFFRAAAAPTDPVDADDVGASSSPNRNRMYSRWLDHDPSHLGASLARPTGSSSSPIPSPAVGPAGVSDSTTYADSNAESHACDDRFSRASRDSLGSCRASLAAQNCGGAKLGRSMSRRDRFNIPRHSGPSAASLAADEKSPPPTLGKRPPLRTNERASERTREPRVHGESPPRRLASQRATDPRAGSRATRRERYLTPAIRPPAAIIPTPDG
mmetsp:Transcript_23648/g.74004  ORF Transcript_23648/g.74004 Transcript_23648/m.74004 type:complete len:377 (+) Transcript_23648:683-1813(+)